MDTKKYKMGWLLVAFDLPVLTKPQRKVATSFRKFLLKEGYLMIQFSVYARSCVSFARQKTHMDRLKKHLPPEGRIRGIFITRSQWDRSFVVNGNSVAKIKPEALPKQMQLW